MATLDLTDPVDVVRLNIGDTSDLPIIQDAEIQYALDSNNGNIIAATKQSASYVYAQLSYRGHERLDKLEFWGAEVFNNYRTFLKDIINNPIYNATGGIYCGGIDKEDFVANANDDALVQRAAPSYFRDVYEDVYDTIRTERTY